MRPAKALIDLDAFRHNLSVARRYCQGADLIAVLKADAYGHGLEKMSVVAEESGIIDKIALASIEEAKRVRAVNVSCPIVLLEGIFESDEIHWCIENNIEMMCHSAYQLEMLESVLAGRPEDAVVAKVWLKLNTGMNRLGFSHNEAAKWARMVGDHNLVCQVGVMMHFACADDPSDPRNIEQMSAFFSSVEGLSLTGDKCLCNSAALLSFSEAIADAVRPGIMLYGSSPVIDRSAEELGLKPVMRLVSKIIAVRDIAPGDEVGYGATWSIKTPGKMGIVAIGYADGYPRHASNKACVFISGERVPVIGRVSMDMLAVDLTHHSSVVVGDEVELWGAHIPVDEVAGLCGTISYELVTGVTPRVPRFYLGDGN